MQVMFAHNQDCWQILQYLYSISEERTSEDANMASFPNLYQNLSVPFYSFLCLPERLWSVLALTSLLDHSPCITVPQNLWSMLLVVFLLHNLFLDFWFFGCHQDVLLKSSPLKHFAMYHTRLCTACLLTKETRKYRKFHKEVNNKIKRKQFWKEEKMIQRLGTALTVECL